MTEALILFSMFAMIAIGLPIAVSILASALLGLWLLNGHLGFLNAALSIFDGATSFPLIAIPLFILAGALMNTGGISTRLITFVSAMIGFVRGGLAMVHIGVSLFFAEISGSAVADAAATGSILIPEMRKRGYAPRYAAGVISAAAAMGPIIPPSILFILLASIANLSVGELFIAGILPGFLMYFGLIGMSIFLAKRYNIPREPKASWEERKQKIKAGILPLGAPVIIIVTKVAGIATPTEAAAIVVAYTLIIGFFVYHDMTIRRLIDSLINAAMTTAVIMMTVAFSQIFGQIAVLAGLGRLVQETLLMISDNPYVLFLIINVMLLILGTFLDAMPLMLILSPIFFPLMTSLGVDPIHFGLVMVFNLVLGMITPPIGLNLFVTSGVAGMPMMSVVRAALPFLMILVVFLIMVTYIPFISTWLPNLVMGPELITK